MNFLVVSADSFLKFTPRALRCSELVRELLIEGHKVTLVSSSTEVPKDLLNSEQLTMIKMSEKKHGRIRIVKHKKFNNIQNKLSSLLTFLFEYPNIQYYFFVRRIFVRMNFTGYDALISIAQPYPLHWGIASLWSKNSIAKIWIADCGDPYALVQNVNVKTLFYFKLIEKWFMRKCDFVTVPLKESISCYYPEFHEKIVVIPQGLSFPEIKSKEKENNNPFSNQKSTVRIGYAGNITAYGKKAKHFFRSLDDLTQDFQLFAFADFPEFYSDNMTSKVFSKCIISERIDRLNLLEILSGMDFFIYFPYDQVGQRPFKLIDYTFLNKPILEYRGDDFSIQVLNEFMQGNFTNRLAGVNLEEHKIEVVADAFVKLIVNNK